MKQGSANTVVLEAKRFLAIVKGLSEAEIVKSADDVLLFCYRLLDEHVIVRSTSPRFPGRSFSSLRDVIYQLESKPDETLGNPEWRGVLQSVLEDIVDGRVVVSRKSA